MANEAKTAVKVGDKVMLVVCRGLAVACKADKINKDGTIDLTSEDGTIEIHSSPRDDDGKRPDSWRPQAIAEAATK